MAIPIWKDCYVTLGSADSMFYRISLHDTSEVIYSGKAYKRPGETSITARINDICADWIENVLPVLSQAEFTRLNLPVTFDVTASADGTTWTSKGSYQFLNDWSYDYGYNASTMGLSFPVNGRIDARMPITWTALGVSSVTATIYRKNGTSFNTTIQVAVTGNGDFNNDFNNDFSRSVRSAASGTAVFFPSTWSNVAAVKIGTSRWTVVTDCAKYALYYVNAYGGWDSLLIEANDMEADTLRRYTREVVYDNNDIRNRGIQNYVNEITKSFTLHTGWLKDSEAALMHHLVNSTDVYLYDIATSQMIPVTIPTTSLDYKTFKNQGNKLVNYTLQVQVAQNRIRR